MYSLYMVWICFQFCKHYYYTMIKLLKNKIRSLVPLVHLCCATSVVGYSCNYYGKRYGPVQERRAIEKIAMKEYYEKHGGDPGHH